MNLISKKQIYFWQRNSQFNLPWQRQHLNIDFLKCERKRIEETKKWHASFTKAKLGQIIEDISYYVLPTEIDSFWKAAIASKGNYVCLSLSALKNSSQLPMLMLMPSKNKIPKDYSLINIKNPKKDFIHNEKNNTARYVIVADEFEDLDVASVYTDVPYEKRSILKFIRENLTDEPLVADSFQPTISGSPFVMNGKGGISFSAFMNDSSFSQELMTTLKLMQPIEFSDLQFKMPRELIKGHGFYVEKGIKQVVAEKSIIGRNFYSSFSTNKDSLLLSELARRYYFNGEYSIACSLTPRGNENELIKDILSKFVRTEIMHPFRISDLKYNDVDLSETQKNIDEDLWIQIVNQKQIMPTIPDERQQHLLMKQLVDNWEIIFESLGLKKYIEHPAKVYANVSLKNIQRVAQSMARDEQKDAVSDSAMNKALKLFVETSDGLINNPKIQYIAKTVIPQRYENKKFAAVEAELSTNILNINQLFENTKQYFKDLYELQVFVDTLLRDGHIYEPKKDQYFGL